jgi:hypothetical protein
MSERRAGLETANVSAEPAIKGRRPPLDREASNRSTGPSRRGSGVDMRAKEKRVNMGSPTRREASSQPASREDQAGLRRVAERSAVALKRVMIVERRDLSSRVRSEGARARAIGDEPSNLNKAFSRSRRPEMPKRTRARPCGWPGWANASAPLVRKPNAGKLHVRFDERDLETEDMVSYSGTGIPKGPAHRLWLNLTPPRQISTLPFSGDISEQFGEVFE